MLSPSMRVRGMETQISKSERARLKMKTFLADFLTFLLKTPIIR